MMTIRSRCRRSNMARRLSGQGEGGTEFWRDQFSMPLNARRRRSGSAYFAQHDPLTGLINRALFRDRLIHAMARSKRKDQPLAVMLLDLDRFKAVNDAARTTTSAISY